MRRCPLPGRPLETPSRRVGKGLFPRKYKDVPHKVSAEENHPRSNPGSSERGNEPLFYCTTTETGTLCRPSHTYGGPVVGPRRRSETGDHRNGNPFNHSRDVSPSTVRIQGPCLVRESFPIVPNDSRPTCTDTTDVHDPHSDLSRRESGREDTTRDRTSSSNRESRLFVTT